MSVGIPKADLLLKLPFDGSGSFTTAPIDIESYPHLWMYILYTADADVASTIGLRFSVDVTSLATYPIQVAYPAAAGSYSPAFAGGSVALTSFTNNIVPFTGRTAAGSIWFYFPNPPPLVQLVYAQAGGARQFTVSLFGRCA